MAEVNIEKFDIKYVHDQFKVSLNEGEDDITLRNYLDSYQEINKFFHLMGPIFGFVSSDIKSKIDILFEHIRGEEKFNFRTIKTMMVYEQRQELLYKEGYVSGSRTLLRLHRGLDFIKVFLSKIMEIEPTDKTSQVCREAYDQTLAQYHPWIIKKGAHMAMFTMPTREQLLHRIIGHNDEDVQRALDLLPKMLEITGKVYNRVDNLYTKMDLHSLP